MSVSQEALLRDLPPYLSDEPRIRRFFLAFANELDRVQVSITALAERMLPPMADADHRLLAMWERLLGLPEDPPLATVEERQIQVGARFRARKASSGAAWVSLMDEALAGITWSYEEGPDPYTLSITIDSGTGYSIGGVVALARKITPAHLQLFVSFGEGFIVGDSMVDPVASVVDDSLV